MVKRSREFFCWCNDIGGNYDVCYKRISLLTKGNRSMEKHPIIDKIIKVIFFCILGLGLPLMALFPERDPLHFFGMDNNDVSDSWSVFFCIYSFCNIILAGWLLFLTNIFAAVLRSVFGKKKRTFASIVGFILLILLIVGAVVGVAGMKLSKLKSQKELGVLYRSATLTSVDRAKLDGWHGETT